MGKKPSKARSSAQRIETDPVVRVINLAVDKVMLDHKRFGHPVVADEQGNPVWVPAAEIVIPVLDEPTPKAKPKRRSKHDR